MKHNKVLAATLAGAMLFLLSGCQLAQEEGGAEIAHDRLLGSFISYDSLDLNEPEVTESGDVRMQAGRLYATVSGTDEENRTVSVDGIDGAYLIHLLVEDGDAPYYALYADGCDSIHQNIEVTDDGNNFTLEGTVYILPNTLDDGLHNFVNPAYQTADGAIYVLQGEGYGGGVATTEGTMYTTTLTDTVTETEDGVSTSQSNTVIVHIAVMYRPTAITLIQMDSDNRIVRSDTYTPGKVPETLTAEPATAYVIVETEKQTPDGETTVTRELLEPSSDDGEPDGLTTFYALDEVRIGIQYTDWNWN